MFLCVFSNLYNSYWGKMYSVHAILTRSLCMFFSVAISFREWINIMVAVAINWFNTEQPVPMLYRMCDIMPSLFIKTSKQSDYPLTTSWLSQQIWSPWNPTSLSGLAKHYHRLCWHTTLPSFNPILTLVTNVWQGHGTSLRALSLLPS